MNRAIPLLLLTAAIAGGLVYFAFLGPGAIPPADPGDEVETVTQPDTGARAVERSPSRADLAAVNPDRAAIDVERGGAPAREWEIIPMNQVGQPIATAKITATLGGETKTAEGRIRWTQIPSGTWTVVIEAEDHPVYQTEVTLQPDSRKRTVARLGDEIRVQGRVIDTFGQPVARATMYFLPTGIGHPSIAIPLQQANGTAGAQRNVPSGKGSKSAKNLKGLHAPKGPSSDTVAIQTDTQGRFRAVLPKPDKWRVSVGPLGDARWTQSKGNELKNGGPDTFLVTVPALAQMGLVFSGPDNERPSQVTVYHFDAELAARMASQRGSSSGREGGGEDRGGKPVSMEEAQMIAKKRAMERQSLGGVKSGGGEAGEKGTPKLSGTARSSLEENQDVADSGFDTGDSGSSQRPVNTPLFEPGWRALRSVPVTQAETMISDLPGREDLRFLFVRGKERITTSAATRLRENERSLGTVTLPRPVIGSATVLQSNLATVSVRVLPQDESLDLEPGVVLTFKQ